MVASRRFQWMASPSSGLAEGGRRHPGQVPAHAVVGDHLGTRRTRSSPTGGRWRCRAQRVRPPPKPGGPRLAGDVVRRRRVGVLALVAVVRPEPGQTNRRRMVWPCSVTSFIRQQRTLRAGVEAQAFLGGQQRGFRHHRLAALRRRGRPGSARTWRMKPPGDSTPAMISVVVVSSTSRSSSRSPSISAMLKCEIRSLSGRARRSAMTPAA